MVGQGCKINALTNMLMHYRIKELIMILKKIVVKNFNAEKKLRKPAVPTVNTDIPESKIIPWSRTCLGDRSFDVTGRRLWNKLPASLR